MSTLDKLYEVRELAASLEKLISEALRDGPGDSLPNFKRGKIRVAIQEGLEASLRGKVISVLIEKQEAADYALKAAVRASNDIRELLGLDDLVLAECHRFDGESPD